MARKPWADLSPAYRRRLERAGITAGTHKKPQVKKARGRGTYKRRKAWDELTPDYRKRLENAGITAEDHKRLPSLKKFRGHGAQTPSERRKQMAKDRRDVATFERLLGREKILGYLPSQEMYNIRDSIGLALTRVFVQYQEYRHKTWIEHGKHYDSTTWPFIQPFQLYVEERFGDEAWTDILQDWWDESGQDAIMHYYH